MWYEQLNLWCETSNFESFYDKLKDSCNNDKEFFDRKHGYYREGDKEYFVNFNEYGNAYFLVVNGKFFINIQDDALSHFRKAYNHYCECEKNNNKVFGEGMEISTADDEKINEQNTETNKLSEGIIDKVFNEGDLDKGGKNDLLNKKNIDHISNCKEDKSLESNSVEAKNEMTQNNSEDREVVELDKDVLEKQTLEEGMNSEDVKNNNKVFGEGMKISTADDKKINEHNIETNKLSDSIIINKEFNKYVLDKDGKNDLLNKKNIDHIPNCEEEFLEGNSVGAKNEMTQNNFENRGLDKVVLEKQIFEKGGSSDENRMRGRKFKRRGICSENDVRFKDVFEEKKSEFVGKKYYGSLVYCFIKDNFNPFTVRGAITDFFLVAVVALAKKSYSKTLVTSSVSSGDGSVNNSYQLASNQFGEDLLDDKRLVVSALTGEGLGVGLYLLSQKGNSGAVSNTGIFDNKPEDDEEDKHTIGDVEKGNGNNIINE